MEKLSKLFFCKVLKKNEDKGYKFIIICYNEIVRRVKNNEKSSKIF